MPDDLGGQPFADGEGPDNHHHGDADDEFAAVVFDEDFVRAAEVHEPTAAERLLAAAQSHAEREAARGREMREAGDPREEGLFGQPDPDGDFGGDVDGDFGDFDDEGRFDRSDYADDEPEPYAHGYGYGADPAFEHGSDYGYAEHAPGPGAAYGVGRPYGRHGGELRPYRGYTRWQRPVAWVLAVVMGIGMVALAFSAVRGAGAQREEPAPPPATTGVGVGHGERPSGAGSASASASAETAPPAASADPR